LFHIFEVELLGEVVGEVKRAAMPSTEKIAEATAASEPQTATTNAPSVLHDESAVVDIEKTFAAWICVFGSFLFLMPTYGKYNVTSALLTVIDIV
jgi:hypothetical protein